jgi:anti-anti-sigma regulatory factor
MTLLADGWRDPITLRPIEEWDSRLESEIESEVLGLMTDGNRDFIIDLDAVTHIKFSVLPDLLGFHRQLLALGGSLALQGPSAYLLNVLAAGDVPGTIPIYPSEACAALGTDAASAATLFSQEGERERTGLGV